MKSGPPEPIAQQHDVIAPAPFLTRRERAADLRLNAQSRKQTRGRHSSLDALRIRTFRKIIGGRHFSAHVLEHRTPRLPIEKIRKRRHVSAATRQLSPDEYQPIRLR